MEKVSAPTGGQTAQLPEQPASGKLGEHKMRKVTHSFSQTGWFKAALIIGGIFLAVCAFFSQGTLPTIACNLMSLSGVALFVFGLYGLDRAHCAEREQAERYKLDCIEKAASAK